MINRLIEGSLRNRVIVIVLYLALAGWGWWALQSTPIDAIPDLSDNQVIVFTDYRAAARRWSRTRSPTRWRSTCRACAGVRVRALAVGLRLLDDLRHLRRQGRPLLRANARAGAAEPHRSCCLPGWSPTLGPDGTGVGHVFWYTSRARRCRSAICDRCRTGSSATSSTPCRVSPRSPPSVDWSGNTRSMSTPTVFAYHLTIGAVVDAVQSQQCQRGRQR